MVKMRKKKLVVVRFRGLDMAFGFWGLFTLEEEGLVWCLI